MAPYFGLTGGIGFLFEIEIMMLTYVGWLTFWISVACSTDMTLFGYDQGVFGGFPLSCHHEVISKSQLDLLCFSL
jgi:hypothetical protein